MVVIGNRISKRISEIFNLPGELKSFNLVVCENEIVSVKCEFFPNESQVENCLSLLSEYELHKKDKNE